MEITNCVVSPPRDELSQSSQGSGGPLVSHFWRTHPKYWFAPAGPVRDEADRIIHELFWNKEPLDDSDWIDHVIYLDQFMRHFSRLSSSITEDDVIRARESAVKIVKDHIDHLKTLDEFQLVFCLMPFKHLKEFDFIFNVIHTVCHKKIVDFPLLMRFYADTYSKYYLNPEIIARSLNPSIEGVIYVPDEICDYCPPLSEWATGSMSLPVDLIDPLKRIDRSHKLLISLSGGVDSMSMCYLLKRLDLIFTAVHIVYGNREASSWEAKFISDYCRKLDVPLVIYRIEWLRRADVDREFYERVTRQIRFMVYRIVAGSTPHVILGHIQDDIIENIWTNFAHGTHLDDLFKMAPTEEMDGVVIVRPWLSVKKSMIYDFSTAYCIPYLKNTTPSWSNRGKFRERFHKETLIQYGESVDHVLITTAAAIKQQFTMVDKLLYQPIFKSWDPETKSIDVTRAMDLELDATGWSQILAGVCHEHLHIAKPSIHACHYFAQNILKPGSRKIVLSGMVTVNIVKTDKSVKLIFLGRPT